MRKREHIIRVCAQKWFPTLGKLGAAKSCNNGPRILPLLLSSSVLWRLLCDEDTFINLKSNHSLEDKTCELWDVVEWVTGGGGGNLKERHSSHRRARHFCQQLVPHEKKKGRGEEAVELPTSSSKRTKGTTFMVLISEWQIKQTDGAQRRYRQQTENVLLKVQVKCTTYRWIIWVDEAI